MTSNSPRPASAPIRIAVTGSSGFVGRHLVRWLQRQGHAVRSLSRQAAAEPGVEHVQVPDYMDVQTLSVALAGCDAVVHLAARAHVLNDTANSPAAAFDEANRASAVAVAQAARQAGLRRMVLVSSIGVNGAHSGTRPFTADDRPAPAEPYAASKWQAEQAVKSLLGEGPTEWVVLRPTLVYGADCPGNFRRLLKLVHRLPLVPLGGLHRRRSLVHVDNLCDALGMAAQHPCAAGRTFVLSDGHDLSVAQVARLLAQGMGKAGRVWAVPEAWLRLLAGLAGRDTTLDKLALPLEVDSSAFGTATGWLPPLAPEPALLATARAYLAMHS